MKDLQEGGNGITSSLADLSLVHEGLVEQGGGILLLLFGIAAGFFSLGLLARGGTRYVESHLDQLVLPRTRLLPPPSRTAQVAVRSRVILVRGREFDGDLVASGEVGVGYLGVGDLEGGLVLDVEDELGLAKLGLAPVPPPQGVFFGLEVDAVPELEELAQALEVLLLEAVEEDELGGPLQNLDLEALGRATPLGRDDVAAIEGEGVAAGRRFPAQPVLGESALPGFLGQVEVDVVELLTVKRLEVSARVSTMVHASWCTYMAAMLGMLACCWDNKCVMDTARLEEGLARLTDHYSNAWLHAKKLVPK